MSAVRRELGGPPRSFTSTGFSLRQSPDSDPGPDWERDSGDVLVSGTRYYNGQNAEE